MGDPRHSKKKYKKPKVPWQEERLDDERVYMERYGLRRKQELYRSQERLKEYKETAKRLATEENDQATKEKQQLFNAVNQYGLLQDDTLTDVLSITLDQLLGRRLQTLVVEKDLAHSPAQARQFISHDHIAIDGEKVTSPSYLVTIQEEPNIHFHDTSPYSDQEHPERPKPEAHEEADQKGNTAEEAMEEARNDASDNSNTGRNDETDEEADKEGDTDE